jgi:hypothetical protein
LLTKKLDALGVVYIQEGFAVFCEDGTEYLGGGSGSGEINQIMLMQTSKGLKIGDSVRKAKELYGEIELTDSEGSLYYQYKFSENAWFSVIVDSRGDDAKVSHISVEKIPSWWTEHVSRVAAGEEW